MFPSPKTQVFTKIIAYQNQAKLTLQSSPKLQRSIESRWQDILERNPAVGEAEDIFKLLVQDLFDELKDKPSDLLLAHWLSFLCDLALAVSKEIFKMICGQPSQNTFLQDIQSICIGSIGHPQHFFKGFDLKSSSKNNLLISLQAYAYRSIKYSAYPAIRKEFNDPNIGRSNLSLFNHYSDLVLSDALLKIGLEPAQQDQDLVLCRCAREYLRQKGKKINQLQPADFDRIGDLYQVITGDLPPPVCDRLEKIGEAIRRSTSPRLVSLDMPIMTSGDKDLTMVDILASAQPQPDEYVEEQEIQADWKHICDDWFKANMQPRDRQIMYLRYHFRLKQDVIGSIVNIDQTVISKILRKINLGIAKVLIQKIDPESHTSPLEICKIVAKMLQENSDKLSLAHMAPADSRELAKLIQTYRVQHEPAIVEKIRAILDRLWN